MKAWIKKIFVGFCVSFCWFFQLDIRESTQALKSSPPSLPLTPLTPLIRGGLSQNFFFSAVLDQNSVIKRGGLSQSFFFSAVLDQNSVIKRRGLSPRATADRLIPRLDISFRIKEVTALGAAIEVRRFREIDTPAASSSTPAPAPAAPAPAAPAPAAPAPTQEELDQQEQWQRQCIHRMIQRHLKFEKRGGDDNDSLPSTRPYLSFRDSCQKDKETATACCSSPNACEDTALGVAKGILPLGPAILATWKGYKASKKAGKGEASQEEFAQEMCDIRNKMGLGTFASQLLGMAANSIHTTCKDKIESCQESCNKEISDFKDDFRNCFEALSPQAPSVENITRIADFFNNEIESDDFCNSISNCKQGALLVKELSIEAGLCNNACQCESKETCLHCDEGSCDGNGEEACANAVCMNTELAGYVIGYALLFDRAYQLSSALDGKRADLSESSDEKEIVRCNAQPDRVPTPKRGPGAPINPPALGACQRAVQDVITPSPPTRYNGYQANGRATPTPQAAITANTTKIGEQRPFLVPNKTDGLQDDDETDTAPPEDLFPEDSRPGLKDKLAGWKDPPGSGGGAPPGGGGALAGNTGGGGGSGSDEEEEEEEPSYLSDLNSPGSFGYGGDGGYSGGALGGLRPSMASSRLAGAGGGKDDKKKKKFKLKPFDPLGKNKSGSIFDLASQRIQQFCSDYSCPH